MNDSLARMLPKIRLELQHIFLMIVCQIFSLRLVWHRRLIHQYPSFQYPSFSQCASFRAVAARNTESPSREARLALPEAEWFGVGILGVARSAPARRYTLLPGCGGSPESPQSGETAA